MTKLVSTRRHGAQWIWPLLLAATIVIASSRSRVAAPHIAHFDKLAHFAVFGLLASLVCRMGRGWRAAALALLVGSFFGAVDEWHQHFTPGRSVEVADWAADTLGAALAVALYTSWPLYQRCLETPLFGLRPRVENRSRTEII